MRKILALFLAVFCLFSVLTGCSEKAETPDTTKQEQVKEEFTLGGDIPSGAVYITIDGEILSQGKTFPEPKTGDILQYGDYRYGFEKTFDKKHNMWTTSDSHKDMWSVHVLDETKTEYSDIPTTINNKKVNVPEDLYKNCKNIGAEKTEENKK